MRPVYRHCRHADNTSIVPQAAANHPGKRQTTMPGNDAITTGSGELLFDHRVARCKYKPVDRSDTAINGGELSAIDLDIDALRQRTHPDTALRVDVSVSEWIPFIRQRCTSAVVGKAATTIRGLDGERCFTIAHHHMDLRATHQIDDSLRVGAIAARSPVHKMLPDGMARRRASARIASVALRLLYGPPNTSNGLVILVSWGKSSIRWL